MYAIIATGGKQYRVSEGDVLFIEKIDAEVDSTVSFDVLLVENEGDVKVGTPVLEGVKAEGKVVAQGRGEKIIVFKYKAKKNYRRKQGHRQPYTKVEITKIG
jgi:large subunit ribosomal protein L21